MVRIPIPPALPTDEIESPVVFPADPTGYAGIPSTFPISISQITAEFGGNSLLTAAPAAGLSAPVSISSFAGKQINEGSGTFTSAMLPPGFTGNGFSTIYVIFGTPHDPKFPNGGAVGGLWQVDNQLTLWSVGSSTPFNNLTINGVKRTRAAARYSFDNPVHQWLWFDVPANTILAGPTYEPIWRTS